MSARVDTFSIVAEQRYEFAGDVEAAVHQVKIEVEKPIDVEFCGRLVEIVEQGQRLRGGAHAAAADRLRR